MHMLTKIGRFSLQSWLAGETTYAKSFPRAKQGKSGSAQILDQISVLRAIGGPANVQNVCKTCLKQLSCS